MKCKIVTAYAYSRKFGQYVFAGYVEESYCPGLPNRDTFKILANYTIDDCKETARQECLDRIYKDNLRHPANMPIEHKGRVSLERAQGYAF